MDDGKVCFILPLLSQQAFESSLGVIRIQMRIIPLGCREETNLLLHQPDLGLPDRILQGNPLGLKLRPGGTL